MGMMQEPHYHRHRFPAEIIVHAVWLYSRSPLSFRDVEDLLAERGTDVSFQTVCEWAAKFGLKFAHQLQRRSQGQFCDKWYLEPIRTTDPLISIAHNKRANSDNSLAPKHLARC
ncbi:hypothetical protein D3C80_802860 [compost metagenome]